MTFRSVAGLLALATTAALAAPAVRAIEPPPPVPGFPPAPATASRPAQAGGSTALPAAPAATATAAITSNREIVLELGKRTISLIEGGKVLGKWPVAIGDPGTPTPTVRYSIRNKVVNPQYQRT